MSGDDIAIVGGGVIGLALAHALIERGRRVTVLERGAEPGRGASHVAGGVLAPTGDAANDSLATLGNDSLARYPAFVQRLEALTGIQCNLRDEGVLWVAFTPDEEAQLARQGATWRGKNLAAQPLTAAEVLVREPHLSAKILSGWWIRSDHQIDPRLLVQALAAAITLRGGTIEYHCEVKTLFSDGGAICGMDVLTDGTHTTRTYRTVVLAAGAWSTTGIDSPLQHLAVRPVKGQVVRLRGQELIKHVVRTPEVYLIPRRGGELIIGATLEERGFSSAPTAGAVMDLLRQGWRALPGIYDLELAECSVGVRPAVIDHLPVIGPTDTAGLYVATGHYRDGILLAPATAHYLAECIDTGQDVPALAPFSAARFAHAN